TRFEASGEIYYVIAGRGETTWGLESIAWETGDVFCLPGGVAATHRADGDDALLWIVTNEPELAFEPAQAPRPGQAPLEAVHYPDAEIRRQIEHIHRLPAEKTMTGKAVTLSSAALDGQRTCLPSLTLAMNSLLPGESQRPHRHNAIAVTLVVHGPRCHSMIDGERVDWTPHAANRGALAPQRGGRARALPDRAGRRALLPLPDDGIQLRVSRDGHGHRTAPVGGDPRPTSAAPRGLCQSAWRRGFAQPRRGPG